jgi:hypothetical protein
MRTLAQAVLGVVFLARPLVAQQRTTSATPGGRDASCLDSIAPTALRRTAVYLESDVSKTIGATAALTGSADLLSQTVAEGMRGLLGAAADELPAGDSVVAWRGLAPDVAVTAYRDGHFTWRTVWPETRSYAARDDDGARLVSRALELAKRQGDLVLWDQDATIDSLTWTLRLVTGRTSPAGQMSPPGVRMGFLAFTIGYPVEEHAHPLRARIPRYPPYLKMDGFTGSVVIQFVVDTTGRPVPESVHDNWPPTRERLTGDRGRAYATFVAASAAAVRESLYTPARIGGCVVPQMVSQPFTYELTR